jgi:hypothetical protein
MVSESTDFAPAREAVMNIIFSEDIFQRIIDEQEAQLVTEEHETAAAVTSLDERRRPADYDQLVA